MPDDAKRKAISKAVKAAQRQFERDSKAAREARRKAFAQAQKEGLSLRDIGELVGLDHTRVRQIIRDE
jgi:DNA-directed RNA polymerase specialized sigma24 family protein